MAAAAAKGWCSDTVWSQKKEGSPLPLFERAAQAAAAGVRREPDHPSTKHNRANPPTRGFPTPLDRQFLSEPRMTPQLNSQEYSIIFNREEFCRTEVILPRFYNVKADVFQVPRLSMKDI